MQLRDIHVVSQLRITGDEVGQRHRPSRPTPGAARVERSEYIEVSHSYRHIIHNIHQEGTMEEVANASVVTMQLREGKRTDNKETIP